MQISQLIEQFLIYRETVKNSSPRTITNYRHRLGRFSEFVGDLTIDNLKLIHITNFRVKLSQQKLNIKTINYHIIALRAFLKFCHRNDVQTIALEKIELAKIPDRVFHFLTEESVLKLMSTPTDFKQDPIKAARDHAILWILYGSGLRVTELCELWHESIKLDSDQFWVIWKWSKLRSVFLTSQARDALNDRFAVKPSSPTIFCSLANNSFWQKLSRNSIEELVKRYAKRAGITTRVTPHVLRHSFATSLIKKWADIRSVQTLLWHSSITTTQIYTHIDDKYLKKVHDLLG